MIAYNRVHYQRLALSVPRTWADLVANAKTLKAAGITPFAAGGSTYADFFADALLARTIGNDTLRRTLEGTGPRFDEDARYRQVFEAIREIHQPGWFIEHWQELRYDAAESAFLAGDATHMANGSWLASVARKRAPDPAKFQLGMFEVPAFEDRPAPAAIVEMYGYGLMRGGRNPAGARALVRFLASRRAGAETARAGELPTIVGVEPPPELQDVAAILRAAPSIVGDSRTYAPKWHELVFVQAAHRPFVEIESPSQPGFLSVSAFLGVLQKRTDEYRAKGGEEGVK